MEQITLSQIALDSLVGMSYMAFAVVASAAFAMFVMKLVSRPVTDARNAEIAADKGAATFHRTLLSHGVAAEKARTMTEAKYPAHTTKKLFANA